MEATDARGYLEESEGRRESQPDIKVWAPPSRSSQQKQAEVSGAR